MAFAPVPTGESTSKPAGLPSLVFRKSTGSSLRDPQERTEAPLQIIKGDGGMVMGVPTKKPADGSRSRAMNRWMVVLSSPAHTPQGRAYRSRHQNMFYGTMAFNVVYMVAVMFTLINSGGPHAEAPQITPAYHSSLLVTTRAAAAMHAFAGASRGTLGSPGSGAPPGATAAAAGIFAPLAGVGEGSELLLARQQTRVTEPTAAAIVPGIGAPVSFAAEPGNPATGPPTLPTFSGAMASTGVDVSTLVVLFSGSLVLAVLGVASTWALSATGLVVYMLATSLWFFFTVLHSPTLSFGLHFVFDFLLLLVASALHRKLEPTWFAAHQFS